MVSWDSQGPGKYGWPPNIVTGYRPARNKSTNTDDTSPSGGPAWRICCICGDEFIFPPRSIHSKQESLYIVIILCWYDVNMPKTRQTSTEVSPPTAQRIRGADSPAFLLAQVGGHAAAGFAKRMQAVGLTPADAGTLRIVQAKEGIS